MTDSFKRNKPVPHIVGVAGGSGSGKTYFARSIQERLGTDVCEIIYQDNFYTDQSSRFDVDGGRVNFDHPDAIDFASLANALKTLKTGRKAEIPIYDFKTHKRMSETLTVRPTPIIVVDGILIFHAAAVRALFDDLVFFDTPEVLRFERRLARDVQTRGRTPEGVHAQFTKQVKPMHDLFVEPSKRYARTLVRDLGEFEAVLKDFVQGLKTKTGPLGC